MNQTIRIELFGQIPNKKDYLVATINKKTWRQSRFYRKDVRDMIDRLTLQVPAEYRDLKLRHPDIFLECTVPKATGDKDGWLTTVLDVLKTTGVIVDDNIEHCNGRIEIAPAKVSDHWRAVVTLRPTP